mgnify:FL=1
MALEGVGVVADIHRDDRVLGHEAGERLEDRGGTLLCRFLWESHIDAVLPGLDRIRRNAIVLGPGRKASRWVKVPLVPRAAQPAVLDRACA